MQIDAEITAGFWSRRLMTFRRVPGQIVNKVPEGSRQMAKQFPKTFQAFGMTHEFFLSKY